MFRTRYLYFNF